MRTHLAFRFRPPAFAAAQIALCFGALASHPNKTTVSQLSFWCLGDAAKHIGANGLVLVILAEDSSQSVAVWALCCVVMVPSAACGPKKETPG